MTTSEKPFAYTPEAESRKNTERVIKRLIAKNAFESGKLTREQYERRKKELETA